MLPLVEGQRFGRLRVKEELPRHLKPRRVLCQCDCGVIKAIRLSDLRVGKSKSCGCLRNEMSKTRQRPDNVTHGMSKSPEYSAWQDMKKRCNDGTSKEWSNYGGRGIRVCDAWQHDFAAFLAHVGMRPSTEYSIDRFPNNDGNYEPGNVRWATAAEQAMNRRSTTPLGVRVEICRLLNEGRGKRETARLLGVTPGRVRTAARYGADHDREEHRAAIARGE